MAKKQWISVKRGLIREPKHRLAMGECIWLFSYMLDIADWDTGKVLDWKDESAAEDMQMPIRTLREQRRKLEDLDYISCSQKQYGQEISILNWTNPREYSGEVYNPRKGDTQTSPSKDAQGDTQGYTQGYTQGSSQDVTPTFNPKNQTSIATSPKTDEVQGGYKPDLVDLELSKLPAMSIRKAIHEYFRLNVSWETKSARQWMEWAVEQEVTAEQIERAANTWRMDKQFNWQVPTLKGIFEKWQMLMDASTPAEVPQEKGKGFYA
jgi:hypothetical protein